MKTYLVTGGAGFIGSNYIRSILAGDKDIKVINLDCLTYAGNLENLKGVDRDPRYAFINADVRDWDAVLQLFTDQKIDYVVHFAAESHVDRSIENPGIFVETNVIGTLNLLNAARSAWADGDGYINGVKYVQVSTDEVYGSLGEDGFFTEDTPLDPHSPYSASKTSADLFVKAYWDTFQFPANITRCSNNYGPYQFPEKLIPLMINNALSQKNLPVYGKGLNVRDWLYVEDHCKAIEMVLQKAQPGEIYNIGGHNERRNIEIVKTVINYIRENVNGSVSEDLIKYVADRKGHDLRYGIDPTKIKNDLGWYPETSFDNGIKMTIQWYIDNKEWLDNVTAGSYREYYEKMYMER